MIINSKVSRIICIVISKISKVIKSYKKIKVHNKDFIDNVLEDMRDLDNSKIFDFYNKNLETVVQQVHYNLILYLQDIKKGNLIIVKVKRFKEIVKEIKLKVIKNIINDKQENGKEGKIVLIVNH